VNYSAVCAQVVAADSSLDPADAKALYATTSRKILAARFQGTLFGGGGLGPQDTGGVLRHKLRQVFYINVIIIFAIIMQ
jgi:hypothetical protein